KPDILTSVALLAGNGDGTFEPATYTGVIAGGVTGDFNGDGKLDVIAGNIFTNQVSLYLGNGNGTFQSSAKSFAAGVAPGAMATGDFNGDGKLDLVVGPESGS